LDSAFTSYTYHCPSRSSTRNSIPPTSRSRAARDGLDGRDDLGATSARSTRSPFLGASMAHAARASSRPSPGLAGVGGAEVEAGVGRVDVDGVEELAAERLDARDAPVAQRRLLLHQRRPVDAQVELPRLGCRGQLGLAVEADDARRRCRRRSPSPAPDSAARARRRRPGSGG
jgi:hypothetical protein